MFPNTLDAQREYVRQGKCGDLYPQAFRDFAASRLVKTAADDMTLCTELAFLFMRWDKAQWAASIETLERLSPPPAESSGKP